MGNAQVSSFEMFFLSLLVFGSFWLFRSFQVLPGLSFPLVGWLVV